MIKTSLIRLRNAARDLFRRPPTLLLLSLLYLFALACAWLFVTTREATVWQLIVTALAALLAAICLPALHAAIVAHGVEPDAGARHLIRRTPAILLRVLIIGVPLLLVGALAAYAIGALQRRFGIDSETADVATTLMTPARPRALRWSEVVFATARLLLLGVALPLALIHFSIAAAREGVGATLRSAAAIMRRAFAARSLLIYALGALAFGVLPYFLIFTRTPLTNPWAELSIFSLRLLTASALMLLGWTITVAAESDSEIASGVNNR